MMKETNKTVGLLPPADDPFSHVDLQKLMYSLMAPTCVGVPGNILAMFVAGRTRNREISSSVYIMALALADTVLLVEQFLSILIFKVLEDDLGLTWNPTLFMQLNLYILYVSGMLSSLFLSAMSVDRFIAIRFPMAASRLCTTKRAKVTVIIISVAILLINIPIPLITQYVKDEEVGIHVAVFTFVEYPTLELIASNLQLVIGTILPFLIIFISNILIIATVRQASKQREKMEAAANRRTQKDNQYLTRMLLFVSFTYIAITLPYRILQVSIKLPALAALYDMTQVYWRRRYVIGSWSLWNLYLFNSAVNFYIYCVGGGRRYRQDVLSVLGEIIHCCRVSQ